MPFVTEILFLEMDLNLLPVSLHKVINHVIAYIYLVPLNSQKLYHLLIIYFTLPEILPDLHICSS